MCICKVTVVLSLILVILKEISMRHVTPFFLHSYGVNNIALLHLQESYSLSVIMYAIPALSLTNRDVPDSNC